MKKNILSSAILLATSGTVNAAAITSITISDVWDSQTDINDKFNTIGGVSGTDGSAGRFGVNQLTTSHWTGDTGVDMLWGGTNQGAAVFTSGFDFIDTTLRPNTDLAGALDITGNPINFPNGGAVGDITDGVLTVSNLDFGGLLKTVNFYQAPDAGTLKTNFINDIGGDDYEVAFSWSHMITSTEEHSFTYVGFTFRWIVEGVAHTSVVPVPATAWLMGSGLAGLAGVARQRKSIVA